MTEEIQKPYTISFSFSITTERRFVQEPVVRFTLVAESVPLTRSPKGYLRERIEEELQRKFDEAGRLPYAGVTLD
jgi:hypothetical protein